MLYPTIWRERRPSVWPDLLSAHNEFERMFDRWFGTWSRGGEPTAAWLPVVDVRETPDELLVQAELPGLSKDDVDVRVENGVLTISGERKQEFVQGKEDGDYHLVERRYGRFERSFTLPRTVDPEKVEARFENGVLGISVPKVATAKPRQVKIK